MPIRLILETESENVMHMYLGGHLHGLSILRAGCLIRTLLRIEKETETPIFLEMLVNRRILRLHHTTDERMTIDTETRTEPNVAGTEEIIVTIRLLHHQRMHILITVTVRTHGTGLETREIEAGRGGMMDVLRIRGVHAGVPRVHGRSQTKLTGIPAEADPRATYIGRMIASGKPGRVNRLLVVTVSILGPVLSLFGHNHSSSEALSV